MKKEILKKIVTHIFSIAVTVSLSTVIITVMVNHSMDKRFDEYKKKEIEQLKEEANEFNQKIKKEIRILKSLFL